MNIPGGSTESSLTAMIRFIGFLKLHLLDFFTTFDHARVCDMRKRDGALRCYPRNLYTFFRIYIPESLGNMEILHHFIIKAKTSNETN